MNFWEHIPEHLLLPVVVEMERTCHRGLHGIGFATSNDPTRVTIHDRKWWRERLPKDHEVVDAEELRAGPLPEDVVKGDGHIKINVGSFVTMSHFGWTNIDVHDLQNGFAAPYGYNYLRHDVRQGLPFGTGTVDLIAMSHFLEHLNYDDGLQFLRECRRVIKPSGAMRIAVPAASQLLAAYCDDIQATLDPKQLNEFDEISNGCASRKLSAMKLWEMLLAGHSAIYDWDTLHAVLADASFESVCAGFRQPGYPLNDGCKQILRETLDIGVEHSIFTSAIPAIG